MVRTSEGDILGESRMLFGPGKAILVSQHGGECINFMLQMGIAEAAAGPPSVHG